MISLHVQYTFNTQSYKIQIQLIKFPSTCQSLNYSEIIAKSLKDQLLVKTTTISKQVNGSISF